MRRFDDCCTVCGADAFRRIGERSDGIPVIVCTTCGHGVVEYFRDDLHALYGDEYFAAAPDSTIGYTDYDYTAQHAVSWASALIRMLRGEGRVLDIGCANGHLLRDLGEGYERFGIEPNPVMAGKCRDADISVISSDLLDARLPQRYEGTFDLAAAIAVFEHLPEFRKAFEAAFTLIRPDGLLLFEVPVLSEPGTSDVWFRTSLEHIHYPTEKSLRFLFEHLLGIELVGATVLIQSFGTIFIGLASKSTVVTGEVRARFEHLLHAQASMLTREEARFRWFLYLIHAGNPHPDVLSLFKYIDSSDLGPSIIRRLVEVWTMREERAATIEAYLKDVEKARDWHAQEVSKREAVIAAQIQDEQRHVEELELADERSRESERLARRLLEDQERATAAVQIRMRELEESWSWKITAPLRWLGQNWLKSRPMM